MTDQQNDHGQPFTLANRPPKHRPAQFANVKTSQRVLLAGMDCLPGQSDLFATDGENSAPHVEHDSNR